MESNVEKRVRNSSLYIDGKKVREQFCEYIRH